MYLKDVRAEIPRETEDQVIQLIKEAGGLLPFLVDLPKKERVKLAKHSRKREDFLNRGLMHAQSNPGYLPTFIGLDAFNKDMALHKALHRIISEVNTLQEKLKDTVLLVDSRASAAARVFYKTVKAAAGVGGEGAEAIARDLAYHYQKKLPTGEEGGTTPDEPATGNG